MFYTLLADAGNAAGSPKSNSWLPILLIGGFFILMIIMTIVPQRKRQKQMQNMLDNLSVGDKIMTIGRMIGKVVFIDTENKQVVINVGTDDVQTLITIDRNAVGYIVDSANKPAEAAPSDDAEAAKNVDAETSDAEKSDEEKKDDDLKI